MRKHIEFYRSLDAEHREMMFIEMMTELEINPETGKRYDYEESDSLTDVEPDTTEVQQARSECGAG